ncbi:hypothetical protein [Azospirillum largimobile]
MTDAMAETGMPPQQPAEPDALDGIEDRQSLGKQLAAALEWPTELPEEIVHRAANDRFFLHQLIGNRRSPEILATLIGPPDQPPRPWRTPPSSPEMMLRASAALLRWARAGFGTVDRETFERRQAACRACPNLTAPGDRIVHKLFPAGKDGRVCDLCGCAVERKAQLPTEDCPAPDPLDQSRTRWGDPRP